LGIGIEAPVTINGIYKSTDAGMSWTLKTTSGVQVAFNNFSIAGARVWSLHGVPDPFTGYRRMKHSTDLGETWTLQPLAIPEAPTGVSFASQTDGWAITARTILHTTTGGVTSVVSPLTLDRPATFRLEQNYPNPFNPSTTIRYQLPKDVYVTLKVYNLLGQEVATLVNEEKGAGSYHVEFDGEGLASGMYLYRIQAGDFVDTKRLLLLK
ncbi:MAG: T9SS type A sorting domain-containing protein, partial [Ignavibacteria bacterium]|nr:T9SS type A sorting domain-containing protein [Ignavibacteria bacterium]